jgi:hypothetical protein
MNVVYVRRSIQTDCDTDMVALKTVEPSLIDQNAIGGYCNGYFAFGPRGYRLAAAGNLMEILYTPQQRLSPVQNQGKFGQGVLYDVLFDAPQQLTQHFATHQLGLAVYCSVAEPITIRAIDVTSRSYFDKQL